MLTFCILFFPALRDNCIQACLAVYVVSLLWFIRTVVVVKIKPMTQAQGSQIQAIQTTDRCHYLDFKLDYMGV